LPPLALFAFVADRAGLLFEALPRFEALDEALPRFEALDEALPRFEALDRPLREVRAEPLAPEPSDAVEDRFFWLLEERAFACAIAPPWVSIALARKLHTPVGVTETPRGHVHRSVQRSGVYRRLKVTVALRVTSSVPTSDPGWSLSVLVVCL
jgi:hypothetical protein